MARWRICDEHWYWFIPFSDPDGTDEINLWPCRHCGAMVMGIKRNLHTKFHIATNTCFSDAFNPDEDLREEETNVQVQ
jgi:hypothetical protein